MNDLRKVLLAGAKWIRYNYVTTSGSCHQVPIFPDDGDPGIIAEEQ